MSETAFTTRFFLATLALAGATFLTTLEARAITYGEPDCENNATNEGCRHPNTVQLSTFGPRGGRPLVANSRCSGSLIAKDANRFIILTAGHCGSSFIRRLRDGVDRDLGVTFDAEIIRDLPQIGPVAWTPKQFILGGQPVLAGEYAPAYWTWVNHFDYAVVVFDIPEGLRRTWGGKLVDLSAISPVNLPELDYLRGKVNAANPLTLVTVGYGMAQLLRGPGEGGNAGGRLQWNYENFGKRWITSQTSASSFMGRERHLLMTSQNPARGYAGSCYGDSGGPLFYVDEGVEIQVAITSSGDNPCRATGFNVRTDGARAVEFLNCVTAPDAELIDILACGCTAVNAKGVCAAE